jgi:N6-L-threonylcarbamoyladenine synthase
MPLTPPVLAIDTALAASAVGLLDAGGRRHFDSATIGVGHAEYLMPQIGRLVATAGLTLADVRGLVVVVGPGSFTGIRAGLAAARGFALALSAPLVGVTTLEALAAEGAARLPGRAIVAALDARRDQVYAAARAADGTVLAPPALLSTAAAADLVRRHDAAVIGSAAAVLAAQTGAPVAGDQPQAGIATVLALGAARAAAARPPAPLYLRAADAKIPTNAALPRAAGPAAPVAPAGGAP